MTIRNFTDIYHKNYDEYLKKVHREDEIIAKNNAKIETAKRSITRAEIRRCNIEYPYWTEQIVEEIAKEMLKYFPDGFQYKIMGPFGIDAKTSIWIKHPEWDLYDEEKKKLPMYEFEFSPSLDKNSNTNLYKVDRSVNTGEYPPNSIGGINGFNHPNIPIDNNTSIIELIKMFYPEFKQNE